ncbi:MAG: hypothetical protein L6R41_006495 [Letrouitia leprolyta]|nr:MAG: hypothetical protein L6R41_006495 [Letrouitia leprolyta]
MRYIKFLVAATLLAVGVSAYPPLPEDRHALVVRVDIGPPDGKGYGLGGGANVPDPHPTATATPPK